MHFHQHGYVSADPRIEAAAGCGIDRPEELPDEVDVLIVGSGPAGMIAAAQLSQYPEVNTRLIEKRDSRLVIGQADGIQARSVETFQAFGFAEEIMREGYHIVDMSFWNPDPENPEHIIRTGRPKDDEAGISEFPHLIVNQARVLDYFAQFAKQSPGRITPDYGIEFVDLAVDRDSGSEHPVAVTVRYTSGERAGEERTIRAGYVVGCDGARSGVRRSIGRTMTGDQANHAWGVMDVLANSDFPDIRTKCAISSKHGNILHIPREGGHLFRMYVDLGEVPEGDQRKVRQTSIDDIIAKANAIITPYSLDVKNVAWHSVYEVGHRLTDAFDDADDTTPGAPSPRVFITGDACHTHSAKAGQGMNVSMQDGFNIAWKLGQVLSGRSSQELLRTYSAERQVAAKNLIDFDKEWSTLMATPQEELPDASYLEDFYVKTAEFPAGFMTEYAESMITTSTEHQELSTGFPVGKRFKSARVQRNCDGNFIHLGHEARADGRWRVYVFADAAAPTLAGTDADGADTAGAADETDATPSKVAALAAWLESDPASPLVKFRREGEDLDSLLELSVIYQQGHTEFSFPDVPTAFRPHVGEFGLEYVEKIYATLDEEDIFEARGISRDGAVVVVRPDQYVSGVFPLDAHEEIGRFFDGVFLPEQ
ncbi:FAD-binding monooxygenase [Brevibacterium sp. GP-SGM9]|uniref:FAD-binding monooxygenase n=1 Tax=unclassified Brevibacterium TaxID=2614124 RepID=UPI001E53A60E|nr:MULTISPECIES: FAD-binding monooxygenase [unclassified Brevibacterium]MCD1287374.1 phenol 2-monooxygenase [Brevibacterium sp. CCUG 69071]MDK8436832.1 FAD-binding monooxygenase [Brevibacterium sp. H-BE7]